MNYQGLYDQLLARAWIEEQTYRQLTTMFWRITGHNVDEPELGIVRQLFPTAQLPAPVRSLVNVIWPKFSAWLWMQEWDDFRTAAGEDQLTADFAERTVSENARQRVINQRNKLYHSSRMRKLTTQADLWTKHHDRAVHGFNPHSDWKTVKPVR